MYKGENDNRAENELRISILDKLSPLLSMRQCTEFPNYSPRYEDYPDTHDFQPDYERLGRFERNLDKSIYKLQHNAPITNDEFASLKNEFDEISKLFKFKKE